MKHRLIIAGSRSFNDVDLVERTVKWNNVECVISGTARGADSIGADLARKHGIPVIEMPADWNKYGKRAGYLRNCAMAEKATACICFWDGKSKGTAHMINIAKDKKLLLKVVEY